MMQKIVSIVLSAGMIMGVLLTNVGAQGSKGYAANNPAIPRLSNSSTEDAFQRLNGQDFVYDERSLESGIYQAFTNRKEEGIRLAIIHVQRGWKARDEEKAKSFHVAKRILQQFPAESEGYLENLYRNGDPEIRGNVVRVVAGMPGSEFTRSLLTKALDDQSFCEEESPESVGDPLRVCDVAYNQIVAHYGIRNVLRTIGTGHRTEVRDYHIDQLKNSF
jgi:hypothetical protein